MTAQTTRLLAAILMASTVIACGGGSGGGAPATPPTTPPTTPPVVSAPGITLLAGQLGGFGNVDGTGAAARFNYIQDVAVDSAGNAYVLDRGTLRKVTPAGVVTTLAGVPDAFGYADGIGAAARFSNLTGIAIDSADNLYLADTDNQVIRKVTTAGVVTTLAGKAGVGAGWADGDAATARFGFPADLAVDAAGNIYVVESGNLVIRKITPAGNVTTLAGKVGGDCTTNGRYTTCVSADGVGSAATFAYTAGITVDVAGNVYAGDNNTIRKISPTGVVSTLAGTFAANGAADGVGAAARFFRAVGLAADAAGNIYVTDTNAVRKVTPTGIVSTLAGVTTTDTTASAGYVDGAAAAARFSSPQGITVDSAGNLYVADQQNASLRKISPTGVASTVAGRPSVGGNADGSGAAARFNLSPEAGGAVYSGGNLYITDAANFAIRKVTATGVVTTLAGGASGTADGTGSAARFSGVLGGLAADASGNLYVGDSGLVRKITPAGVVTTVANVATLYGAPNGIANQLSGIAVDSTGNLYAADAITNVILKITSTGAVSLLAGQLNVQGSSDGAGAAAGFNFPEDLEIDAASNLYVADGGNNTIRKITPAGVVTTLAGTPGLPGAPQNGYADGTGPAARFLQPNGLSLDSTGNLYVSDRYNHAIRKLTPAGVVTTVAGVPASIGVVPGNLPGSFGETKSVTVGEAGVLYVTSENSVLKVQLP